MCKEDCFFIWSDFVKDLLLLCATILMHRYSEVKCVPPDSAINKFVKQQAAHTYLTNNFRIRLITHNLPQPKTSAFSRLQSIKKDPTGPFFLIVTCMYCKGLRAISCQAIKKLKRSTKLEFTTKTIIIYEHALTTGVSFYGDG